jgi:hypothetical protein
MSNLGWIRIRILCHFCPKIKVYKDVREDSALVDDGSGSRGSGRSLIFFFSTSNKYYNKKKNKKRLNNSTISLKTCRVNIQKIKYQMNDIVLCTKFKNFTYK